MAAEPCVALIDDDEAVLDSLQVLLEAEGLQVRTMRARGRFSRMRGASRRPAW